jgi:hypothetical protein
MLKPRADGCTRIISPDDLNELLERQGRRKEGIRLAIEKAGGFGHWPGN